MDRTMLPYYGVRLLFSLASWVWCCTCFGMWPFVWVLSMRTEGMLPHGF